MSTISKDSSLYGVPRPTKKTTGKEISSVATLAFTSRLSSLISSATSASSNKPSAARARPKKDDIFSTHNRNAKKRALKDLDPDPRDLSLAQKHTTKGEKLDDATWMRSKRKMEEKARLYAAMKRGDVDDADERYAVDFDRKWAEGQAEGKPESDTSDGDDSDGDDEPEELIEYTDEFGRTRKGTRAEAAREEYRKRRKVADEPDRFSARPAAPTNIIYGDAVQSAAFNPDEPLAQQMAELAAKRDRSVTPPPASHFDASKEVRTKGVGFFQFSGDAEVRKKEMEALERERKETERKRSERGKRVQDRRAEVEKRKKEIAEKRGKRQADNFLQELGGELDANGVSYTSKREA
ncbi:hypothetical protein LTR66_004898 [Elasticomyces elasticus]|nr:hypothetical protein LTR50_000275 [Elasticomyces elasticus]KAK4995237.1 hypothetical protein LTR66_004898 [Elasticomyces elasticus]